ncbi:hypothetical protein BJ508DRAFT_418615 [Ascobolus immersus RN42]|uniref:Uncharacterized protein n=1 Tax=Ascobolus immersus RN42 TaxID=1160509 RepID=A0A3N4HRQ9_ASCIM|nr:hypothetical protein BJ508DRAFT_418615 [Ascobolus immersus RN42]
MSDIDSDSTTDGMIQPVEDAKDRTCTSYCFQTDATPVPIRILHWDTKNNGLRPPSLTVDAVAKFRSILTRAVAPVRCKMHAGTMPMSEYIWRLDVAEIQDQWRNVTLIRASGWFILADNDSKVFGPLMVRSKRGLVRQRLLELLTITVENWAEQLRCSLLATECDLKVEDSNHADDGSRYGSEFDRWFKASVVEPGEEKMKLLRFLIKSRSESIEERIWRHLHAEDEV